MLMPPRFRIAAAMLAVLIAQGIAPLGFANAVSIPDKVMRSTVFIGMYEGEAFSGRASGVIITKTGDVATNRHVVEDAFGYSTHDLWVVPTTADEELDFACMWKAEKYVPSSEFDLAVLKGPKKLPCQIQYLTPSRNMATTGTEIRTLGYPAISFGSTTLTTLRGIVSGPVNENGVTIYQKTDAKIIGGNSGGPVIDSNENLIGLAAARTTTTEVDEEILGLIVPAMHIYSFFSVPAETAAKPLSLPTDVDPTAWFASAVSEFTSAGHLASNVPFRGGEMATRAEFIDLLVAAHGGPTGNYGSASFTDIPVSSPYFAAFEEAGARGWVRGTGECYGSSPCHAKPNDRVNRAEAAALLNRAYSIAKRGEAPVFADNGADAWYHEAIQTAADHCVLRGDASSGQVRPSDPMNRAEMVVMISRVTKGLTFGNGCRETPAKTTQAARSSAPTAKTEIVNDPKKNPALICKETNSVYNSATGKCECPAGHILGRSNKCVTYSAFCKERDSNAEWDVLRETCFCAGDTEPSADGQSCVLTHSAKCKAIDPRAYSHQGNWCVCEYGYRADESKRHCIPADPSKYYEIHEREVFSGN